MALTNDQTEKKYKYYLERYGKLEEWNRSLSHNLDKLIFGLASGTIVLSMTFIGQLGVVEEMQCFSLVKLSWLLLVITLIFNVMTYFFSMGSATRAQKILKEWFNSDREDTPDARNILGKITSILNTTSLATLILGISLLAYFTSINY